MKPLLWFLTAVFFAFAAVDAYAATLTLPLPQGCTLVSVSCPDVAPPGPPNPPPPLPPPAPPVGFAACAAAGYTARVVDVAYPVTGVHIPRTFITGFGNATALVVHFRTPTADSGTATFTVNASGGAANVNRVAALSNVPCVFPSGPSVKIPAAIRGQAPTFNLSLWSAFGTILVLPNTDYYITVVNRDDFGGTPSCWRAGAPLSDCPVYIDAN